MTASNLENDSNSIVKRRPKSYNKPSRRQALLEIYRLLIQEGLSHSEIQLQLNLKPASYFRYLNLLFKTEREAFHGNEYTIEFLNNETVILIKRYHQAAREFRVIAEDPKTDAEQRIKALDNAYDYLRAAHDLTYYGTSYLIASSKTLPGPKKNYPSLSMSRQHWNEKFEEPDPSEKERLRLANEIRRENIQNKLNQEQK